MSLRFHIIKVGTFVAMLVLAVTMPAQSQNRDVSGAPRTGTELPEQSTPPPPPPPMPPPPPEWAVGGIGPGKFESKLVIVEDDFIARIYTQASKDMRGSKSIPAQSVEQRLSAYAQSKSMRSWATHVDGEIWEFVYAPDQAPTLVWRDIDYSDDANGYFSERIGYCRGDEHSCNEWFEDGRHRSREPDSYVRERAYSEWMQRVFGEPCRRRPDVRPDQSSLLQALATSKLSAARVSIRVVLNACGDVRDDWVTTSSRNRDIDRAAQVWVRQSRFATIAAAQGQGRGMSGALPFEFKSAPEPAVTEPMTIIM